MDDEAYRRIAKIKLKRRGEGWAWWTLLVGNTVALVSAMRMDWIFNTIGPFELTEYLGLVLIYVALTITALAHTVLEDKALQKELPGYADYAARVKYRLLPGIWQL